MSDGLDRIAKYFEEFRETVSQCRAAPSSLNLKSAYGALGRIRERYLREKRTLTAPEKGAMQKVFEDDKFIDGMMHLRQLSEHVVKFSGKGLEIRTTSNEPIAISVEVSALPCFMGPIVRLPDVAGRFHTVDHLKSLNETERRIRAALTRAGAAPDKV